MVALLASGYVAYSNNSLYAPFEVASSVTYVVAHYTVHEESVLDRKKSSKRSGWLIIVNGNNKLSAMIE